MNLDDIQAELARQDQALATAMNDLNQLGDVQIQMPAETLRDLDDACTVRTTSSSLDPNYLNSLRA
ncbi:hypothetical protein BH09MYX1_BH09MYX1_61120 [soil metagenome]